MKMFVAGLVLPLVRLNLVNQMFDRNNDDQDDNNRGAAQTTTGWPKSRLAHSACSGWLSSEPATQKCREQQLVPSAS